MLEAGRWKGPVNIEKPPVTNVLIEIFVRRYGVNFLLKFIMSLWPNMSEKRAPIKKADRSEERRVV